TVALRISTSWPGPGRGSCARVADEANASASASDAFTVIPSPAVIPLPAVIPAKAGIHLDFNIDMAGIGAEEQMDPSVRSDDERKPRRLIAHLPAPSAARA